MKSTLSILLISSFFLTGCYSQMYYTDTTYRRDVEWHADTLSKADSTYVEGYEDGYDDALDKFHYKNYAVADWYARHGFGM
ncbi:hypothetical protein NC796_06630 [Aliifodinibius sp. S!AR15-10]|uniref:hypothetical protein n=1 Tax=Aliifodinibius sp. S!AR15-10 TaxID=2950437 RepID=UPI00285B9C81|nr:hypothetical protein [Aliifodinibius sp. S!AR15-10]MDR8390804.1 hypothetical protein [Aliifodinibius sp. S!AR15-10]